MRKLFAQFARFGVVGLVGLVIDFGVFNLLRATVFELWDDAGCATDVESNEPLAAETAAARAEVQARIEIFVRRFMPRGSDVGYTDSMLARLDAKRCSPRPFRPYANVALADRRGATSSDSTPADARVIAPLDHRP